ncbi:MAG: acylphosphatase [Spirochaetes bacterium]|nr:acylphosphatase [Spirochaetota bacterium]
MATKLILTGRVQGVFCRAYCSRYAQKRRIRGSASNLSDGSVKVLLDTSDMELVNKFIADIKRNPDGLMFYGRIESVDVDEYAGSISGDYQF